MAVICWAGPLAEAAFGELRPRECLEDLGWLEDQMDWIGDGGEMSSTDRAGMFAHSQVRRACKDAARILAKHFAELEKTARLLMDTAPAL